MGPGGDGLGRGNENEEGMLESASIGTGGDRGLGHGRPGGERIGLAVENLRDEADAMRIMREGTIAMLGGRVEKDMCDDEAGVGPDQHTRSADIETSDERRQIHTGINGQTVYHDK